MPYLFEVSQTHIEQLDAIQLTDLLRRLLLLEAARRGLARSSVEVALKIDVPDGGEDGHLEWEKGPEPEGWLPRRVTLYQVKSKKMSPEDCAREVRKPRSRHLKDRVQAVVEVDGAYVLFYGQACNSQQKALRIKRIREAFEGVGVGYAATVDIDIFDSGRIANWTNEHLAAVAFVLTCTGQPIPVGMMVWETWRNYDEYQLPYVSDEKLDGYIASLRAQFLSPRAVARIVGLSGLGKTRLALEAFRPPSDESANPTQAALSRSVVYVDAGKFASLPVEFQRLRASRVQGLVVVDECDFPLHQRLVREVRHAESQLSLLTLDLDPDSCGAGADPCIRLDRMADGIIDGLVGQTHPQLSGNDRRRVVEFAQGFPRMAVGLANERLQDLPSMGQIDRELVGRMVWGRETPTEEGWTVLSVCALFEYVGFAGRVADQRATLADICKVDPDRFYQLARQFLERGILYQRGDFVRVTPLPLALHLAARWFRQTPPETITDLLTRKLPPEMLEPLTRQLARLDFLPEAKRIVEEVCRPGGPFSNREVLDSEVGSQVISSLAEVHPEAVAAALDRAFGRLSREELLAVERGRRHLIWCLEKLCVWRETFHRAARLMLAFGAAENESWGNNATHQFIQLFQLYLSGTQVPAEDRLSVMDEALASDDPNRHEIVVRALCSALRWGDLFTRTMGAESQGSRPPATDWEPVTNEEVLTYWAEACRRLRPFLPQDSHLGELARSEFERVLPGLLTSPILDEVGALVEEAQTALGRVWTGALDVIQETLKRSADLLTEPQRRALALVAARLLPSNLPDRLRWVVVSPPWAAYEPRADGNFIDLSRRRAEELATQFADAVDELVPHLHLLTSGEVRQGFAFGWRLGEASTRRGQVIEGLLTSLRAVAPSDRNTMVLCGILAAASKADRPLVSATLDKLAKDDELCSLVVGCTAAITPSEADLERLCRLRQQGRIEVRLFHQLNGSILGHLSPSVVGSFVECVAGAEALGAALAVQIVHMYTYDRDDLIKECAHTLRRLLGTPGILAGSENEVFPLHAVEDIVGRLVAADLLDAELAAGLTAEIIAASESCSLMVKRSVAIILSQLLRVHAETVWPLLGRELLHGSGKRRFWLSDLLRRRRKDQALGRVSPIDSLPDNFLLDWCRNKAGAPAALAGLCEPLRDKPSDGPYRSWTPLAAGLLAEFGEQEEVTARLRSNAFSGAWSGSEVPRLENRRQAFSELLSHPREEVRAWAQDTLDLIGRRIRLATGEDEEQEFGIW